LSGKNPAMQWQKAFEEERKRTEIPQVFKRVNRDEGMINQYGLVETAVKNFDKSKARLSSITPVGM